MVFGFELHSVLEKFKTATFGGCAASSAKSDEEANVTLAQVYGTHVPWELPVQYCSADCLSSGDDVLDIGGHIGAVAIALSRLVGEGRVFTFEPNRDIWADLLLNLELNAAKNVVHVPLACFSESGKLMKFYSEDSFYKAGSGLMRSLDNARSSDVITISVDDFCDVNNLSPTLLKIDVEGAEIHVLRSAENLLSKDRPAVILEYQAVSQRDRNDPLDYLAGLGYVFYDVNTYDSVSAEGYSAMSNLPLANVFCVHGSSTLAGAYKALLKKEIFETDLLQHDELVVDGIEVGVGRYIFKIDFDCPDNATAGLAIRSYGRYLAYYEAVSQHLRQHSCSSMVVRVDEPQVVSVELIKKGDYDARLRRVSVNKLENLPAKK
jgi:FkbM family methyltransferase